MKVVAGSRLITASNQLNVLDSLQNFLLDCQAAETQTPTSGSSVHQTPTPPSPASSSRAPSHPTDVPVPTPPVGPLDQDTFYCHGWSRGQPVSQDNQPLNDDSDSNYVPTPPRGCRPSRAVRRAPVRRPTVARSPAHDSDYCRDMIQSPARIHSPSPNARQPLAAKHLQTTSGPGLFICSTLSLSVFILL